MSKRAVQMGSPANKLGVVVDGGDVRMSMMSCAAWVRKSFVVTFGKGKTLGKNSTVSQFRVARVRGKWQFTQQWWSIDGPTCHHGSALSSQDPHFSGLVCATAFVPGGAMGVDLKSNSPKM